MVGEKFFLFLLAYALTHFVVFVLKPFAPRIKLVDSPGGRKHHVGDVPVIGGLAMYIGVLVPLLWRVPITRQFSIFLLTTVIILFMGLLDDRRDISHKLRLVIQIFAGVMMTFGAGVILHSLGNIFFYGDVHLSFFGIPLTIFAVVSLINAMNMMDGIDGLAGGLALNTFILLFVLSVLAGDEFSAQVLILFVAVVVAFLQHNFKMISGGGAKIFMGDSGSMFLGFAIVWFAVSLTQGTHEVAQPVVLLWLVAIPLFDFGTIFIRRLCQRKSPFHPDRQHLHHILLDYGYTVRQITLLLLIAGFCLGLIGIITAKMAIPESISFSGFIFLFIIYFLMTGYALKYRQADYMTRG